MDKRLYFMSGTSNFTPKAIPGFRENFCCLIFQHIPHQIHVYEIIKKEVSAHTEFST